MMLPLTFVNHKNIPMHTWKCKQSKKEKINIHVCSGYKERKRKKANWTCIWPIHVSFPPLHQHIQQIFTPGPHPSPTKHAKIWEQGKLLHHFYVKEVRKGRKRNKLCTHNMKAPQNFKGKGQNVWTHPWNIESHILHLENKTMVKPAPLIFFTHSHSNHT